MTSFSMMDYAAQTAGISEMRAGLIQHITNESVFLRILNFVKVDGMDYRYSKQMTLGSIAFRGVNEDYTADTGVVNPEVETMAIFGGKCKTDVQFANKRGGVFRAQQIGAKTRQAGLYFDRYCINGDPASIAKSFYGLKSRLTGNQVIYAGGGAANGNALTLDDVDLLLDRVAGPNAEKVLIMNKACRRTLKKLVLAAAGGAAVTEVGKGVNSYDGASIEVMDEDGDESAILDYNEARGSSNVTASMYCIRPGKGMEGEWVQGLVGSELIQHTPLAQTGTSVEDLIEMHGGLAVFHGRAAARLGGILNS